jgi:hypothetical protein
MPRQRAAVMVRMSSRATLSTNTGTLKKGSNWTLEPAILGRVHQRRGQASDGGEGAGCLSVAACMRCAGSSQAGTAYRSKEGREE